MAPGRGLHSREKPEGGHSQHSGTRAGHSILQTEKGGVLLCPPPLQRNLQGDGGETAHQNERGIPGPLDSMGRNTKRCGRGTPKTNSRNSHANSGGSS